MKEQELRKMREECKKLSADCDQCIYFRSCCLVVSLGFPFDWTDEDINELAKE